MWNHQCSPHVYLSVSHYLATLARKVQGWNFIIPDSDFATIESQSGKRDRDSAASSGALPHSASMCSSWSRSVFCGPQNRGLRTYISANAQLQTDRQTNMKSNNYRWDIYFKYQCIVNIKTNRWAKSRENRTNKRAVYKGYLLYTVIKSSPYGPYTTLQYSILQYST